MTMRTQIWTDIDFEKPGKQQGYLMLPYSDNEAGWASIEIPITVVANGGGKTLLATGGTHGDEFEGCVALMKLARDLQPEQIQGRVIIIPALNLPAVRAGTRLSPIDGRNLNRAFPGTYNDTATGLVAHYVSLALFPIADVVMDIHSGGKSMIFAPCTNLHRVDDEAQWQRMLAASIAWGAPYAFVYADIAGSGLLPVEAERLGKTVVTTEMGGAGQCSPEVLRIAETGIRNVMVHEGLIEGTVQPPPEPVQVIAAMNREDYHFSPADGIYESVLEVGASVEKGQLLGRVHFPERWDRAPEPVVAQTSGILICRRFPARIRQGDCAATVANNVTV